MRVLYIFDWSLSWCLNMPVNPKSYKNFCKEYILYLLVWASFSQVKRQPWYFTDRVGYCIFSDIDGELSRLLRPLNQQLILVGINCDQGWAQWEEIIYFCYVTKKTNDVIWPLNLQTSEHLMSDIYTTKSW